MMQGEGRPARARWRRHFFSPTLWDVTALSVFHERFAIALGLVGLLALGCSAPAPISECQPTEGLSPICGFQNPEDLVVLPGGAWVAISQYQGPEGQPGSLVAFRNSDDQQRLLFPPAAGAVDLSSAAASPDWGDPACPGPPDRAAFAPHGIDVLAAKSRSPILAVVNHGGREAIELFEVAYAEGGPALGWRGCIPMLEGVLANDVVLLRDGSVFATHMMGLPDGVEGILDIVRLFTGGDTGEVLAWRGDTGWVPVLGSEGAGPNGLAVSADGGDLYFSEWSASRLVRIRLDASDDTRRSSIELPHHPDNLSWTADGRLLVAGQVGPLGDALACGQIETGTCALGFSILRIEPATLESDVLLSHSGTSMGAASVAIEVGDELLIGTFAGDRIARAPYKD